MYVYKLNKGPDPANNFAGYRIYILYLCISKGSEKSLLILSSHHLFNSLTGYPVIRPAGYPANETGYPSEYKKRPDIRYNPKLNKYIY